MTAHVPDIDRKLSEESFERGRISRYNLDHIDCPTVPKIIGKEIG